MLRAQKVAWSGVIKEAVADSALVIVVHWNRLTVSEVNGLRHNLRAANGSFRVVKNNLLPFALGDGEWSELHSLLEGSSALACAYGDIVAASKVVVDFAKETEKIDIRGGMMDGRLLAANDIHQLASLPPLDVLRARLIGALTAPQSQLVSLLTAPSSSVARVVSAFAAKGGG